MTRLTERWQFYILKSLSIYSLITFDSPNNQIGCWCRVIKWWKKWIGNIGENTRQTCYYIKPKSYHLDVRLFLTWKTRGNTYWGNDWESLPISAEIWTKLVNVNYSKLICNFKNPTRMKLTSWDFPWTTSWTRVYLARLIERVSGH